MYNHSFGIISHCALSSNSGGGADTSTKVATVDLPPVIKGNLHYVSNEQPLIPNPLIKLPIGSIKPKGWLLNLLKLSADGMVGKLAEISPYCKFDGNAWVSPIGEGDNGWEEVPYWLKGYGDLGYILNDDKIIAETKQWIEGILTSQAADGYFGPRKNKEGRDLWPNMVVLNVLQSYYEYCGDERILKFMERYFQWELNYAETDILPEYWAKMRGGDNLESIYWLYNRIRNPWLLNAAKRIHECTAPWANQVPNWHGVNIAQGFREPAIYYIQSRNPQHLYAAERNYQEVRWLYGQAPGGMYGADENARPGYRDPRQGAETCSMVEFMHSFQLLSAVTGNPVWGDRCEEIMFNDFPASILPDFRGLHYLTAPNQPQLDSSNKSPGIENPGDMFSYSAWKYRCCQHNVSHGVPYYAEHLWMATQDNGLAAILYASNIVAAKVGAGETVSIAVETDYPFNEKINFKLTLGNPTCFPLYFRIPEWCKSASIFVNGAPIEASIESSTYLRLERLWKDGDEIDLILNMSISLKTWKENKRAVSIAYGPLWFSLKIGEKYERIGGTDEFPAYEVYPTTPWNYALELNKQTLEHLHVEKGQPTLPPQPFTVENAPLVLKVKGRKITQWTMTRGLVNTLQQSPVKTSEPLEDLTLIPMGCARLRISAFPIVGHGDDAHEWETVNGVVHLQSNPSWLGDNLDAVSDGADPENSSDISTGVFIWDNRFGTEEWLTYEFENAVEISGCKIYWYENDKCKVPSSWRLMWRDEYHWKPVEGISDYPVKKDQYCEVAFPTVKGNGLKLIAQLQPECSAGVLEWKVFINK